MFSIWQAFEEVPATSKKQLFGNLTTAKVDCFYSINDFFSISRTSVMIAPPAFKGRGGHEVVGIGIYLFVALCRAEVDRAQLFSTLLSPRKGGGGAL